MTGRDREWGLHVVNQFLDSPEEITKHSHILLPKMKNDKEFKDIKDHDEMIFKFLSFGGGGGVGEIGNE